VLKDSKVMKVLKQKIRNRRRRRERVKKSFEEVHHFSPNDSSSAAFVNNDWMNWVT
jgi:exoribonuclease II